MARIGDPVLKMDKIEYLCQRYSSCLSLEHFVLRAHCNSFDMILCLNVIRKIEYKLVIKYCIYY